MLVRCFQSPWNHGCALINGDGNFLPAENGASSPVLEIVPVASGLGLPVMHSSSDCARQPMGFNLCSGMPLLWHANGCGKENDVCTLLQFVLTL